MVLEHALNKYVSTYLGNQCNVRKVVVLSSGGGGGGDGGGSSC
ncbi:hypothetical protein M0804_006529 [Polistes exclamans]|nr:hypothetical protein M0804_006529 [Polistes exclamans]